MKTTERARLLVFNCHEAWVHQLHRLPFDLDIIVGLKGRYTTDWDERIRPFPGNARRVSLAEVIREKPLYHCMVTHNITDLLDVKTIPSPRLLVLHTTIEGRLSDEKTPAKTPPHELKAMLHQYLTIVGGHAVAVSALKGKSWDLRDDILPFSADPDAYLPPQSSRAEGLRISNFISKREKTLLWKFHLQAFTDIPVRLVGHNPDLPGIEASRDWDHLKELLSQYRFYIHTADPRFEDGYNMACLEAMAAGLPVLGNLHPSSPVRHGISGYLSDDPKALNGYARQLIQDRELAMKLGRAARETVRERFSPETFVKGFSRSLETARRQWRTRQVLI